MKKFVLYTAVFGKMARFHIPKMSIPDVDRFCYTDLDIGHDFYQIKKMRLDSLLPVRRNRLIKICIPDEIFNNYEYSLYMDCKHSMSIDFEHLLSLMVPGSDFLLRRHPKRGCIYDEGEACIKVKRGNKNEILKQMECYKGENYPINNGLYAAFWLLRRHTEKMREFSKLWWSELKKHSHRDQLSLPYLVWKHRIKMSLCGRGK